MSPLILAALAGSPAAPPELPPTFTAVSPADDRPAGRLVSLGPDFAVTLATRTAEVRVADVLGLRRTDFPTPPFPTGPHLVTATGDRVAGTLVGGDADALRFAPSATPQTPWRVPLRSAAVLWLGATAADTPTDPARYDWPGENRNRDALRSRNGDTARGTLTGLDPDAARPTLLFRPEQGAARAVPAGDLAAVAFNAAIARTRKPKGPYARVVLADGSRVEVTSPAVADDRLTGEALFGQKVELPLSAVVALDVMQAKAVYLSDLKPRKAEHAGFFGTGWPWAADRTVRGTPLRLATAAGETTFDKGLGTHPRTVLTYDLAGKYRRFEAVVGLEPDGGLRSRAVVKVLVDGKMQDVPGLADLAAGKAVVVKVDVRGGKELVLVVDFGAGGGVRADVNWGDARLVE